MTKFFVLFIFTCCVAQAASSTTVTAASSAGSNPTTDVSGTGNDSASTTDAGNSADHVIASQWIHVISMMVTLVAMAFVGNH
ncbi:hypothetical protein DPMN_125873 [Dreissena polymorpha]|uniref:Uncharacterized protein n=1 Tax=Dreissena polymorpha TaxID=45954 RepID=A0A9D4JTG1_DREPO|nr:hypothetical protein DPMN_125873 [Dreissena polymorpha]